MPNTKEIGNDAVVRIGDQEVPVTNVSYTEEADIAETQFNTGLNPDIVVTGVSYSGSFEHAGGNESLRSALYGTSTPRGEDEGDEDGIAVPLEVDQIIVEDGTHKYSFEPCIVESRDKDLPADDRTSVTYDFTAENLVVSDSSRDEIGLDRSTGETV